MGRRTSRGRTRTTPDPQPMVALRAGDGARDIMPLAIGVFPYAVVVGVLMRDGGLEVGTAMLFSVLIFAGASQIAAVELMAAQAPVVVVLLTMWIVNARFMLYSASMWQLMAEEPVHRRLAGSYMLADQAFVVAADKRKPAEGSLWPYYGTAAVLCWSVWQIGTLTGALLGEIMPAWMPLGVALPLVMMSIAVNHARSRPALVTAVVAAVVAVLARGLPAGGGLLTAIVVGMAAGLAVESWSAHRGRPPRRPITEARS